MIKKYSFEDISHCEMCGDLSVGHKVHGIRLNTSQGLKPKKKHGIAVTTKKCKKCSLIYANPLPIPGSLQDHYGVPPETYWKPSYFEWDEGYFATELKQLKTFTDINSNMKALDIGAGIGKCMISLQKAGFDVYGFEPAAPFYERALSKMNILPAKLKLGMIEDVDYPANTFDFVTFGAVLEHLYHPAAAMEKALKWIKPNGIVHLEVPSSRHFIAKLINAYYRLIGTNYVTNLSPMHDPFHLYEFGLKSFEFLGQKQNFEIIHYEYHVGGIAFFPKFLQPFLRRIMKMTNSGLQLTVWLKKKA
jgi:2-polyprenyl-3-methyl-5-hydroxy-6-metoxy-1,4-benzoquinol methylase